MLVVTRDLTYCIVNVWNNLIDRSRGKRADLINLEIHRICKTKSKGTAKKYGTLLDKVISHEGVGYNPRLLYMYTKIEQLSKLMVDDGSQVSQLHWDFTDKQKRLEWFM